MKEIRIIKQASTGTEELIDEDHSKINGTLESESERDQQMPTPMIQEHKTDSGNCLDRNGNCKGRLSGNTTTEDSYLHNDQAKSSEYVSEDDESIFDHDICNFNNAIKISREWCKGNDVDSISNMLGIPKPVVSKVYYKASNVAENFIRSNIAEWQIGGPGILVTVDTYPEGCANTNPIRMSRPILCITEVKSVPQKYWLETLPTFDAQDAEQIRRLKDTILLTVQSLVRPGSILITPHVSTLCSHSDFDCLKSYYPVIVSTMDLARHNDGEQNVFLNLATIWRSVLNVCEEAQFYNSIYVQQFIVSHMWRRRYRDRSFEVFLYQLSLMQ